MHGVILCGGYGTRLWPITKGVSKQLLPIYDKPMFYYGLSTLMLAGIRKITLVTNPEFVEIYKSYFFDGQSIGLDLDYCVQDQPRGIADVFNVIPENLKGSEIALVLGDNVFYGNGLSAKLKNSVTNSYNGTSTLYAYEVSDVRQFGNVSLDSFGNALKIVEKPDVPTSNLAVTGLYFYSKQVWKYVNKLEFSSRKELEISDLNDLILSEEGLKVEKLGRGFSWFDAGSISEYLKVCNFIESCQTNQGFIISSPEEIALRNNWIKKNQFLEAIKSYKNNSISYKTLRQIAEEL